MILKHLASGWNAPLSKTIYVAPREGIIASEVEDKIILGKVSKP